MNKPISLQLIYPPRGLQGSTRYWTCYKITNQVGPVKGPRFISYPIPDPLITQLRLWEFVFVCDTDSPRQIFIRG